MDGGSGDGRLDLDELGTVVEGASRLADSDAAEVLDDGHGRSWRERAEDSGLSPWARRHRAALAAAGAAAVLAGAAVAAWTIWVPPPLDPQLRVRVTDLVPAEMILVDGATVGAGSPGVMWTGTARARAAYGLTPQDGGDTATYAVLGIEGPAVRASTAHDHRLDGSVPVAVDVDAIVDCSDPASLDPAPGSYALRVARTDAWNRTVIGSVPLADPVQGWPASVSSRCAGSAARGAIELRAVTVAGSVGTPSVALALDVTNRLPIEVEVSSLPVGGAPPVASGVEPVRLAAGAPGRVSVQLEVHDCASPDLYPIGVADPDDIDQNVIVDTAPGIYLNLTLLTRSSSATGDDPPPTSTAEVHWSDEVAARVGSALRAACTGAPRPPSVRVAAVGLTTSAVTEQPDGDTTTDRSVPLVLRVPVSGDRVRIPAPQRIPDEYVGSFVAPASAAVVDGLATLRTTWSYDCSGGGFATPPTVEVRVETSSGEFPFTAQLNAPELSRELLDRCEYADEQQLVDAGWMAPTPASKKLTFGGA